MVALQQSKEDRLVDVHKQPLGREGLDFILDLVHKEAKMTDSDRSVKSESSFCGKVNAIKIICANQANIIPNIPNRR